MHAAAVCRAHCACLRAAFGCPAQQLLNERRQGMLHRRWSYCSSAVNCLVVGIWKLTISVTACPRSLCRWLCSTIGCR